MIERTFAKVSVEHTHGREIALQGLIQAVSHRRACHAGAGE